MKTILMLSMILLLTACGTPERYVQVDKTNMKRFEHDQKVRIGMTKQEVLAKFGTPDNTRDAGYGIYFEYFNKIFCNAAESAYCYLYLKKGIVVNSFAIRMEFNDTVAGD
jgi:hypothetical protein